MWPGEGVEMRSELGVREVGPGLESNFVEKNVRKLMIANVRGTLVDLKI